MGKQAYQKIIEKADWRKSVQVLMDTYQRLCDETY
jgi:hypothetical protein